MFKNNFFEKPCADPEGGGTRGSDPPGKLQKNIRFLSNSGPDPLKITKLPIQHSMLGHHRPANFIFSSKLHNVFLPLKSSHVVDIDAWHGLIEILAEYHKSTHKNKSGYVQEVPECKQLTQQYLAA